MRPYAAKGTRVGILVLAIGSALAGCGGGPQERGADRAGRPAAAAPAAEPARPMAVGGWQVVRVVVRDTGYEPDRIRLEAGVPAKIVFVQEATSRCAAQIRIPDLGVQVTDLPRGEETIVEFTPRTPGTYSFTCGMDMMRGTIIVAS
jgi:plastocyanin